MNRKCFLLVIVIVLTFSAWATPFNSIAHADEAWIIQGNNDSDCSDGYCDSKTLQDALDAAYPGAKLILRGLFDFGADQFVSLKKDVILKGELGHHGEYLTIIKGGMNTFALGWDPALGFTEFDGCEFVANPNTQRWPANFTISDIRFEEPTWSAIMGAATTGATIKNNQFLGGMQKNTGCNAYGFVEDPDGEMSAISFFSNEYPDARRQVFGVPSDNTGQITH